MPEVGNDYIEKIIITIKQKFSINTLLILSRNCFIYVLNFISNIKRNMDERHARGAGGGGLRCLIISKRSEFDKTKKKSHGSYFEFLLDLINRRKKVNCHESHL